VGKGKWDLSVLSLADHTDDADFLSFVKSAVSARAIIFSDSCKNAMKQNFKQWLNNIPSKGGLIGALLGALASSRYHHPEDKPLKNAGKTVVFTGIGFLLGQWLEKLLKKR